MRRKAVNALPRAEVKEIVDAACILYKEADHTFGRCLWVKIYGASSILNSEVVKEGLDPFDNESIIPELLNFITKKDE